jgi:hypothetical protein
MPPKMGGGSKIYFQGAYRPIWVQGVWPNMFIKRRCSIRHHVSTYFFTAFFTVLPNSFTIKASFNKLAGTNALGYYSLLAMFEPSPLPAAAAHVMHKGFVPRGQTVDRDVHKSVQHSYRQNIGRRRPELWGNREVIPPTRQSASPYCVIRQRNFVCTSNFCIAACVIFFRFVTLRFYFIPTTETSIERPSQCQYSGRDTRALQHSKNRCPVLL